MSNSKEIRLLSTRWITYSALGTVMMAVGLLSLMEGIVMRVSGKEIGTYGLVIAVAVIIFSAGISFIGTSVKYRIYLDRKRKQDNEFHTGGSSGSSSGSSGRGHHHRSKSRSGSSRSSNHD